jgi:transposase-like protein
VARRSSPRQTKRFTTERQEKAIEWLRLGNFRESAASRVGVHDTTLGKWVSKGRDEIAARDEAIERLEAGETVAIPELSEYGHFAIAVMEAEAEAEHGMVGLVLAGKTEDIRWFLERRWPHRYGRAAQRVELSGPGGKPVQVQDARRSLLSRLSTVAPAEEAQAPDPGDEPG